MTFLFKMSFLLHLFLKDKEYPVKAMMISNLHAELESVKNSNQVR